MSNWKRVVPKPAPKSAETIIRKLVRGMPTEVVTEGNRIIITIIGLDSCDDLNLREWEEDFTALAWVTRVDIITVDTDLAASIGCRSYSQFGLTVNR